MLSAAAKNISNSPLRNPGNKAKDLSEKTADTSAKVKKTEKKSASKEKKTVKIEEPINTDDEERVEVGSQPVQSLVTELFRCIAIDESDVSK
jgi:hypothetical protein